MTFYAILTICHHEQYISVKTLMIYLLIKDCLYEKVKIRSKTAKKYAKTFLPKSPSVIENDENLL